MKINIKYHSKVNKIIQNGNWIDLFPKKKYYFKAPRINWNDTPDKNYDQTVIFDHKLIELDFSMKLPKHFEANVVPRSSLFMKKGIMQGNHIGIIDGGTNPSKGIDFTDKVYMGYTGNEDKWKFVAVAFKKVTIQPNEPICQFSIKPSMNAPWWIKLKWLFTSKIEFVKVDNLDDINRDGFGSSDS